MRNGVHLTARILESQKPWTRLRSESRRAKLYQKLRAGSNTGNRRPRAWYRGSTRARQYTRLDYWRTNASLTFRSLFLALLAPLFRNFKVSENGYLGKLYKDFGCKSAAMTICWYSSYFTILITRGLSCCLIIANLLGICCSLSANFAPNGSWKAYDDIPGVGLTQMSAYISH